MASQFLQILSWTASSFFANILHTSDNGKLPAPTHKHRTVFSALFEIKQITPFSIAKAASVITEEEKKLESRTFEALIVILTEGNENILPGFFYVLTVFPN